MPSKMVTDRQKVDEALVAALATHRDKVLEGLHARLAPWLPEGVDGTAFAPHYDALTGLIRSHQQRLVEADRRTLAERLEDRLPRRQRDEVAGELRQALLLFRRVAVSVFGTDPGKELLRFDGILSVDPNVVHRTAIDVLESLRNPALELPAHQVPGMQMDTEEWVARLEPLSDELGEILRGVAQDRQETGGVTVEKLEAMDEHDHDVRLAIRYLDGLLRLAGQSALARLVGRAVRARARRSDVEALEEASGSSSEATSASTAEGEAPSEGSSSSTAPSPEGPSNGS